MTLEQALQIIDPDTCYEALRPYAGDCDMLRAKAAEAGRIVADAYRSVKAERDAAVQDLENLIMYGERMRCEFCGNDRDWCAECEVCLPKWRGPGSAA